MVLYRLKDTCLLQIEYTHCNGKYYSRGYYKLYAFCINYGTNSKDSIATMKFALFQQCMMVSNNEPLQHWFVGKVYCS